MQPLPRAGKHVLTGGRHGEISRGSWKTLPQSLWLFLLLQNDRSYYINVLTLVRSYVRLDFYLTTKTKLDELNKFKKCQFEDNNLHLSSPGSYIVKSTAPDEAMAANIMKYTSDFLRPILM